MIPSRTRAASALMLSLLLAGHAALLSTGAAAQPGRKPTCQPVAQRTQEEGCWIIAAQEVGKPPHAPLYWHLYTYADLASAKAARRGHETVTRSLGKVWLMDIAPVEWQPQGGQRVAVIGPLPVAEDRILTAEYMEAISPPGFDSPVHRHPGPEAWYTTTGEVCLETPDGKSVGVAGDARGVVVPGDLPMRLSVTGSELRRSLVVILHDASKPHTVLTAEWSPRGLCHGP